jgi:hypothetical protein
VGGEAPVTPVSSPDSSSLDLSYKPCDNRKYILNIDFPFRQTLNSKGWLGTMCFSQFFNFPFLVCKSSARSLLIPSVTSEREDALGSQFTGPFGQLSEPCIFHDPFLKWIKYFPQR